MSNSTMRMAISWFLDWPLGDAERRSLAEFGDPDLIKEGDKLKIDAEAGTYIERVRE